jgi:hypothetical protein
MATDYDAPRKSEEDQSEESIEELKARRHDKNSGKPRQDDEFTCMSCFLVHHRSQLADEKKLICRDCI